MIDATPEHDVTTEQHRDHIRITDHARSPPPQSIADMNAATFAPNPAGGEGPNVLKTAPKGH
ncbi:MAG TPA: hypothetical protein VEF72_09235, partial [Mycobacterium sp.]|nr:hypothetical protein [Mycobacterium sp.]